MVEICARNSANTLYFPKKPAYTFEPIAIEIREIIVKNILLPCLIVLALGSCTTYDDINFERMSVDELNAYNQGRNLAQMIVCSDDQQRTMSRVRRKRCATVEQMYGSAEEAQKLGILNSAPRL